MASPKPRAGFLHFKFSNWREQGLRASDPRVAAPNAPVAIGNYLKIA